VADEDKERAAYRALVDRVLNGDGRASAKQRARAFGNDGLAPPLDALIDKVANRPAQVTDADQQIEDALAVCVAFNTTDRLADASASRSSARKSSRQERSTC
jgi:hypothetical protein